MKKIYVKKIKHNKFYDENKNKSSTKQFNKNKKNLKIIIILLVKV